MPIMAEESDEQFPVLRLDRLHEHQAILLPFSLNKIANDSKVTLLRHSALHIFVHLSYRMVSENGHSYAFSPTQALKGPKYCVIWVGW